MSEYNNGNVALDRCSICGKIPILSYTDFSDLGENGRLYKVSCPNGHFEVGHSHLRGDPSAIYKVLWLWDKAMKQ